MSDRKRKRAREESPPRRSSRRNTQDDDEYEIRANVKEKGGEVLCSIEETNRIRKELGLKPLEVEEPAKQPSEEIRANVSESGGEVSCSIEETNRIRAQLGLKPLEVEDPKKEEAERLRLAAERQKEEEAERLRAKIEEKRRQRKSAAKIPTKTLGDSDEEEESAAAWVRKSRITEEAQREARIKEALASKKEEKKASYTEDDLSGMKLKHSANDFGEGVENILTLADKPILAGDELNESEDELENIHVTEEKRRKRNLKRKQKKVTHLSFDDEEEDGEEGGILTKYDTDSDHEKKLHGKGARIATGGMIDKAEQSKLEALRAKLMEGKRLEDAIVKPDHILDSGMADYMTQKEFEENGVFKKKGKKKIKKRKKEKLVLQPEETVEGRDHGSRAARRGIEAEERAAEAAEKKKRFETARERAQARLDETLELDGIGRKDAKMDESMEETPKQPLEETREAPVRVKIEPNAVATSAPAVTAAGGKKVASVFLPDDDDADGLEEAIARVKRAEGPKKGGETFVAEQLVAIKEEKMDDNETPSEDKLVFTQTTEFVRAIDVEDALKRQEEEVKKEEPSAMEVEERPGWVTKDLEAEIKQEPDAQEATGGIEEEPEATGIAGAIALLRKTGQIKKEEAEADAKSAAERLRNRELLERDPNAWNDRKFNVKLEYRDEHGHVLTEKEEFRRLSHKFHGKKPGLNKQAKIMKKRQEEEERLKQGDADHAIKSLEAMKKIQSTTGQAYVVLSGSKAKLPSAPPS
eukprot:Rmarinus@m.1406